MISKKNWEFLEGIFSKPDKISRGLK
jgi:hypothetical protein